MRLQGVALAVALTAAARAQTPVIRFDGTQFQVLNWTPETGGEEGFKVYAGPPDQVPPMLGTYKIQEHHLTFTPRFPPANGVRYTAIFQDIRATFDGPAAPANPLAKVARIYPTADVLPGNVLKLYLYFTAPMSRGEAYQHLKLIDLTSKRPIDIPFLELRQELWDAGNQRLTVLFDPGRIKRGLVPADTIGPAIVEGRQYKLVIDAGWHDARGVHLVEGSTKTFHCGPADRLPPSASTWQITAPRAGTLNPLVITFPKPMDFVLLQRMVGIFAGAKELQGSIAITDHETKLRFTPAEAWQPGDYRITADNTLEDIAGNHLDRPFDVDVFDTVTKQIAAAKSTREFSVR